MRTWENQRADVLGTADWDMIARIRQSVAIPCIANGDITKRGAGGSRHASQNGSGHADDRVRGAFGNPWVFEQAGAALEEFPNPLSRRFHRV